VDQMFTALDADFLCHTAWHNLGIALTAIGDRDGARNAFLMATSTGPSCVTTAVAAIVTHLNHPDYGLIAFPVAGSAYLAQGTAYFDALRSHMTEETGELSADIDTELARLETHTRDALAGSTPTMRVLNRDSARPS